jgi:hypothetical protein
LSSFNELLKICLLLTKVIGKLKVYFVCRADEAHHRRVNHTLGDMGETDRNPFKPGQ